MKKTIKDAHPINPETARKLLLIHGRGVDNLSVTISDPGATDLVKGDAVHKIKVEYLSYSGFEVSFETTGRRRAFYAVDSKGLADNQIALKVAGQNANVILEATSE